VVSIKGHAGSPPKRAKSFSREGNPDLGKEEADFQWLFYFEKLGMLS
jgi:hypothetical protein